MVVVSSKIPRNVSRVDGPSSLSGLVGAFIFSHRWFILAMFWWQVGEPAVPAVKKSSR